MLWESFLMALTSLRDHKERSVLTMLGIIIGVGAVIALVSIGMGVREKVRQSMAGLGSNMIIVMPGSMSSSGVRGAAGSNTTLTYKDAQAIGESVDGVLAVAPLVQGSFQIVNGNKNWTTVVCGVTPSLLQVRNLSVAEGGFISDSDLATRSRVAVLGSTAAENLFGESNPIGQVIRINKAPFRVVGVLTAKGQSGMGQDQDDLAMIPLTTAQERMLGITYVQNISVQAKNAAVLDAVQDGIVELLRSRHRVTGKTENDFTVRNLTAMMEMAQSTVQTITLLLGTTAAISLLVGGIGIMNIMLVSVTERTREIGIRKSLGARYGDILHQFLIEAVVICIVGGLIGIVAGVASSRLISYFAGWTTVVSPGSILLSFSFSLLIGVFFGLYPAHKAARLDPIEALRYE